MQALLRLSVESWPQCSNRDALGSVSLALRIPAPARTADADGASGVSGRRLHAAVGVAAQEPIADASGRVDTPLPDGSIAGLAPHIYVPGGGSPPVYRHPQGSLGRALQDAINVTARAAAESPHAPQPPQQVADDGRTQSTASLPPLGGLTSAVEGLLTVAAGADAAQGSTTPARLSREAAAGVLAAPAAVVRPGLSWGPTRMVGERGLNLLVGGVLVHQTRRARDVHCGQVRRAPCSHHQHACVAHGLEVHNCHCCWVHGCLALWR